MYVLIMNYRYDCVVEAGIQEMHELGSFALSFFEESTKESKSCFKESR